ncbi:hypothetical protein EMCG_02616 [[Emmonsia] crescens]|uniref:Uncharacterized protein n=1 Tax=[Emmonsia] crescens TaxID=73230 RepID=A0A0G2J8Y1_9EURO|nr:hypothetical protein EMCG_02616 [Emmonsia crescens UAMH 3008]
MERSTTAKRIVTSKWPKASSAWVQYDDGCKPDRGQGNQIPAMGWPWKRLPVLLDSRLIDKFPHILGSK